ncbi:hypothetical protein ABPG73_022945 [Tetrahymena malaccensis]
MSMQFQPEIIIMKNILYLVSISKKTIESQRNLLNKWFQDSIKNYILEQLASSLIAKHLNCNTSAQVKTIIRQNVDKAKPKYMGIIEQYFLNINKYNQRVAFIEKLNQIIQNPKDITNTHQTKKNSYNIQKLARKQFVCYLILRLFESDQLCTFPSFYEIWNKCFPEEIQTKKKLSKFDKKEQNQKYKRSYKRRRTQKDSIPNSENDLNNPKSKTDLNLEILQQEPSSPSQNIQDCNLFYKSQVTLSENTIAFISQKQPINNKIFEEEEENKRENEEEYVINHNKNYSNSEENFNIQIQYQYDQQNLFIYEKQQYQMYNQEQYQLQQQLKREEEYYYSPEIFSNEQFFIHSQKNFCENAQQINSDGYYNFQTQYQI